MINITKPEDCCGCEACKQICPKNCITMRQDKEGFLYPIVNIADCINCHLCEKVCPIINNHQNSRTPIESFYAFNRDEHTRMNSSSGGVFSLFAEQILRNNGIVFGAQFNDTWNVKHSFIDKYENISCFQGSKYVQSNTGNTYKQTEKFLKEGKTVLFSGTPCQIAGLKHFLRKDYDNLYTIDFICHGVPSPMIFHQYIKELLSVLSKKTHNKYTLTDIKQISFRHKNLGWKKFSFFLRLQKNNEFFDFSEDLSKNTFLKGFLHDLYLRPSCHQCNFKELKSNSDITIGDYWGISTFHPNVDDDKGVSVIMLNTTKGLNFFSTIKVTSGKTTYENICTKNPAVLHSAKIPSARIKFWKKNNIPLKTRVDICCKQNLYKKIKRKISYIIHKISH